MLESKILTLLGTNSSYNISLAYYSLTFIFIQDGFVTFETELEAQRLQSDVSVILKKSLYHFHSLYFLFVWYFIGTLCDST